MSDLPPKAQFYRADTYDCDESLGLLLRRLAKSIVHHADARLVAHDLTHAQWKPMLRLRLGGRMSVTALVRELGMDAGALTRLLDRLESKGLCLRERSDEDRRVVMVSLTDEGFRQSALVPEALSDVFNQHLAGFSEDEWRTLIDLLSRMVANGEASKPDCKHEHKSE